MNHSSKFIIKKYSMSKLVFFVRLKYFGSNTIISLPLKSKNINKIKSLFKKKHLKTYGFYYNKKDIFIDSIETEAIQRDNLNLKFNLIDINQLNIKNLNISNKSFFYKNNLIFIKSINSKSFTKKIF